MDTKDVARLAPAEAVATLRSLPRRFRRALRPVDDDELDEVAERLASAGQAPLDHLVDADRSLTMLQRAVERVLHHDQPVLEPATFDPSAREWPAASSGLESELGHLEATATGFADAIAHVPGADWARTATIAGTGQQTTALDILREAVRTAITDLRAAEKAMEEVRRR